MPTPTDRWMSIPRKTLLRALREAESSRLQHYNVELRESRRERREARRKARQAARGR